MPSSSELRLGVLVLLSLQLLTPLAGISLLGRMSPAVERILEENAYSMEAVEEMLAALAASGDAEAFGEALERARSNITETEEVALVRAVSARAPLALEGDDEARAEVVSDLRELGEVNRASMRRADDQARRLGLAGAWAMALLGFASFIVSLVVNRRIESRLIAPVVEVDAVLASVRGGDAFRRCSPAEDAPGRGRLRDNLNWLLDQHHRATEHSVQEDGMLRATLLAILDQEAKYAVVVGDADGEVLAVNQVGLGVLGGHASLVDLAAAIAKGGQPPEWEVTSLASGGWIARGPSAVVPTPPQET